MLQIVFWNVNKKDLTRFVCSIAESTNADIIVLNENKVSIQETLAALREHVSEHFYFANPQNPLLTQRFHCFSKNPSLGLSEIHFGFRTSVRELQIGQHRTLLALVHGVDIRNYDPENRRNTPYPVSIQPQEEKMPNFLKKSYYEPGGTEDYDVDYMPGEGYTVSNPWVADTPAEFRERLAEVFNLGVTKSIVINLASKGSDDVNGIHQGSQEDSVS